MLGEAGVTALRAAPFRVRAETGAPRRQSRCVVLLRVNGCAAPLRIGSMSHRWVALSDQWLERTVPRQGGLILEDAWSANGGALSDAALVGSEPLCPLQSDHSGPTGLGMADTTRI